MSNWGPEDLNKAESREQDLNEILNQSEKSEMEQKMDPMAEQEARQDRSPFQMSYNDRSGFQQSGYYQGQRQNQNPYSADPYRNNGYQGYPYQDNKPQNYGMQNYGMQGYGMPGMVNGPTSQTKKKKLSAGGIVAIILAVAIVFSALGFGMSLLYTNRNSKNEAAQIEQDAPTDNGQSKQPSKQPSGQSSEQPVRENGSSLFSTEVLEPMTIQKSSGRDDVLTIPEVVEKTAESVVEITTEYVATSYTMQQYITGGAGSGVIVTDNGYIITNNHVIQDATAITVTLKNGEAYPAVLVGLDEDLDIALLKIEASGLTPAVFGTSESLVVGQTIIVIGNPLGQLGGSVTHGIISALDRAITIDGKSMQLMQIDAAVNPGNSGGALFDEKGDLVAIVNAKSSGEAVEGIGFAIPIDHVAEILDDLVDYGYVKGKAAMGITMVDITNAQMAWMYQVSELGPYVYSVNEDSAAAKAGLAAGDRIISVGGVEVASSAEVKAQLSGVAVGDKVEVVISRGGNEMTLTVTMGEYIPEGIKGRVNGQ